MKIVLCTNIAFLTDHIIDYCKPEILARDSNAFRLCVKRPVNSQGLLFKNYRFICTDS